MAKTITMKIKDVAQEHERLVDTLKGRSENDISAELKEQRKELKDYKKKAAKKSNIAVMTPDGKIERTKGKEPLIKDRWKLIKKNLNNVKSILDLKEEQQDDGKNNAGTQEGDEQPDVQGEMQSGQDVESAQAAGGEDQGNDSAAYQSGQAQSASPQEEQQVAAEDQRSSQQDAPTDPKAEEESMIAALKEEGYSDAEISHIINNHQHDSESIGISPNDAKVQQALYATDAKKQELGHMLDHKKRMSDLEFENAKAGAPDHGTEREHKKRMLDLEYETEKKMMELELEFKRKELEVKIEKMKSANREQGKTE